jgi:hypothetical protein
VGVKLIFGLIAALTITIIWQTSALSKMPKEQAAKQAAEKLYQ